VLAEESGRHPSEAALEWCVDPLEAHQLRPLPTPIFASSVGLTWRPVALLGAIEAPALRQLLLGGPRSAVPGATTSAFSEPAAAILRRRCWSPASPTTPEPARHQTTRASVFHHRTRGGPAWRAQRRVICLRGAGRLDGYWDAGSRAGTSRRLVLVSRLGGGGEPLRRTAPASSAEGRLIASAPRASQPLIFAGLAQCRPLPGAATHPWP